MLPQNMDSTRSETPSLLGQQMFGSQLVDKNSATPYSDATQVGWIFIFFLTKNLCSDFVTCNLDNVFYFRVLYRYAILVVKLNQQVRHQ